MSLIRTALFVPATRTDRILKAKNSGADAVIVDLEDAVAIEAKASARQALQQFIQENPQQAIWVRINSVQTEWFEEDLAFCGQYSAIETVMLTQDGKC
ncbi:hypothetical protein V757_08635 [Pelistega indica]|uniref:HpcH/HpaI aldolase/citrate lyase domain-containing protein n=1 Tax=Pelistega indica TaxID=1414851 RepID=V8FZX2_9BURK|nr:aldolase/citrate lyase family protein [Pelistega indica]ETD69735.1 hypothetical protein V757_08635 [Pelistega indica]